MGKHIQVFECKNKTVANNYIPYSKGTNNVWDLGRLMCYIL